MKKSIPGVAGVLPLLIVAGLEDVSTIVSEGEVKQVIDAFVETERVATERTALKRGWQQRYKTVFSEARAGQPFKDPALDDVSHNKRLNGLAARIEDLNRPIVGVCAKALREIDPLLRKAFNEREAIERDECARYGIGFSQSHILRTIFVRLEQVRNSLDVLERMNQQAGPALHCWLMHCQDFVRLEFPELTQPPAAQSAA